MNSIKKTAIVSCYFQHNYGSMLQAYATQKIVRESTVTERSLVTTCTLIDAVRSDANPQGFLISDLTIVENKDIRTYDR